MHAVLAIAVAAILAVAAPAHAQDWPAAAGDDRGAVRRRRLGGSARAHIAAAHAGEVRRPFVVENRSGAGGSIGTGVVAKAPPDGYTLLLGTLSGNVDQRRSFTPSCRTTLSGTSNPSHCLCSLPNLLVVNTKLSAKTVPELIDHLKASDGKVNYGSSGNGTSSHLSAVMFQLASGTKMTHVPFRSTADELNSMIGGHIDLAIDSMTTLWPQARRAWCGRSPSPARTRRNGARTCRPSARRSMDFRGELDGKACSLRPERRDRSSTRSRRR